MFWQPPEFSEWFDYYTGNYINMGAGWSIVQTLVHGLQCKFFLQTGVQSKHTILYYSMNLLYYIYYVLISSGSVRRFALQFKNISNFFTKYRHSPLISGFWPEDLRFVVSHWKFAILSGSVQVKRKHAAGSPERVKACHAHEGLCTGQTETCRWISRKGQRLPFS